MGVARTAELKRETEYTLENLGFNLKLFALFISGLLLATLNKPGR